jgi:hypothetical protein
MATKKDKTQESLSALSRRAFPDIEATLYLAAVRLNDEIRETLQTPRGDMPANQVRKISDLIDLLLLIRKTSPDLADKRDTDPPQWNSYTQVEEEHPEDIGVPFKLIGE